MSIDVDDAMRHKSLYRGENLYVVVSPKRVDLSMTVSLDEGKKGFDHDTTKFRTISGLELVQRLVNELLDRGMSLEDIAGACFECSYQAGDLPGILSKELVR